jgi:hypothetical protein
VKRAAAPRRIAACVAAAGASLVLAADASATTAATVTAPAAEVTAARPDVLVMAVGPRLVYRRLAYADAPPGQLTDFEALVPAPGIGLRADWFPLPGSLGDLGLVAQAEQVRAMRSQTPVGAFVSASRDLGAALQWRRLRAGMHLALDLGAGLHRFAFRAEQLERRLPRPLPDVDYRYAQAGLELRARAATWLAVVASSHYRHVLRAGGVASRDWFPGARVRGLDASAGLECRLGPRLIGAVGLDARLYQLDFRQSTSARPTAGASDVYYSGWARLGVRLGTSGT